MLSSLLVGSFQVRLEDRGERRGKARGRKERWVGRQLLVGTKQGTLAYSVCLDNGLTRRLYSACIQQRGGGGICTAYVCLLSI